MPINKFGFDSSLKKHMHMSEFTVSKIVEKILMRFSHLSKPDREEDYDANGARISNVGNPVQNGDSANKIYVDTVVWTKLERIHDLKDRRLKNLGMPVEENDAVSIRYLNNQMRKIHSMITLVLRPETVNDFHVIDPYDSSVYIFPFDTDFKISRCDFGPDAIEIMLGNTVSEVLYTGVYLSVVKGDKLSFRKINDYKSPPMFVELTLSCSV